MSSSSSEPNKEADTASPAVSSSHKGSDETNTIRRRKNKPKDDGENESTSDTAPIIDASAKKQSSSSSRDKDKVKDDTELEPDDDDDEEKEQAHDDKEGNEGDEEENEDGEEEDDEEEMDEETRQRLFEEKEAEINQRLRELKEKIEAAQVAVGGQQGMDSSEEEDAPSFAAAADPFAKKDEDDMPFILVSFAGFVLFAIFALLVCYFGVEKSYVMAGGMVSFLVLIVAGRFDDSEKDELPLFHVFLMAGCFGVMLGGMIGGIGIIESLPYTS